MDRTRLLALLVTTITITVSVFPGNLPAQTLTILHAFGSPGDGYNPSGPLTFDSQGNLYGTTWFGPAASICQGLGCGTVFQLTPNGGGTWSESNILVFNGNDGAHPGSQLIFDSQANLYGTAACPEEYCYNQGVVFELSPGSGGTWTDTTLHNFSEPWDGGSPQGILFDHSGNIMGDAQSGGRNNTGIVYSLIRASGWRERLDYVFGPLEPNQNGATPAPAIAFDAAGNLYGATQVGGAEEAGVVFELSPHPGGVFWTETVLYTFTGMADGYRPWGVILGPDGNLYGTTQAGGAYNAGTVFELTPNPNGTWTESVIYSFQGSTDGRSPSGGVSFDAAGNVYGATAIGGGGGCSGFGCGVIYKLTRSGGGWSESTLYRFNGVTDGAYPGGPLAFDGSGNIYGVAGAGGAYGDLGGIAFELTP